MSDTRHTPGPWQVVEYSGGFCVTDSRGFEIVEATESAILLDWHRKLKIDHWSRKPGESYIDLTEDEYEANARLIAAAPDLLDALEALAPILGNDGPLVAAYADVEKLVHAAIAKAKGTP